MFELGQRPRWWIAFVAGFVLVLQAFAAGWAAGAMPSGPQLDAFGNPLCITSIDHDDGDSTGDHSKLPNCCTFGCSFASFTVAAPSGDGFALLRPLSHPDVFHNTRPGVRAEAPDHDPGSPRAPPLTI
ncbi:hypothetical protein MesoLjLc_52100 [Mesorhizobium sp. L-8-10]|uniref:DUF2946 family protein n=1 Tax=Mesorhizobium sp. L-8-10 TaxID=2744523 RepID=UPI001928AE7B|nr:DUF2946 family protein [Mesorhizobium sp. L-8-10]BCH33280.1 hypothetical protein MesoLjLc_52100 [Mesorhizobium sp. L-8-10]